MLTTQGYLHLSVLNEGLTHCMFTTNFSIFARVLVLTKLLNNDSLPALEAHLFYFMEQCFRNVSAVH